MLFPLMKILATKSETKQKATKPLCRSDTVRLDAEADLWASNLPSLSDRSCLSLPHRALLGVIVCVPASQPA